MGSRLLLTVIARRPDYADVSNTAFLVLLRMAGTALDHNGPTRPDGPATPARHYFGGWKPLAPYAGPRHKDPGPDRDLTPAAKQAVARAVRELTTCGLICPADPEIQSWFGHRCYEIRV